MKNTMLLSAFVLLAMTACQTGGQQEKESEQTKTGEVEPNTLTEAEKADGWELLFDGESPGKWRGYLKDSFPNGWIIADGMMHCPGSGKGEAGGDDRGDIIYNDKFSNFHLKLDWKISKGGNSGIFYLGQESPEYGAIWMTAPEMQILDNKRHPDASAGKDGNRMAGALYDLIPGDSSAVNPAGEWNTVEVKVYKGSVWHIVNGETVLEYHLWTDKWNNLVADSKFPELNENWADVAQEGYIGLQDHGDDVWFRNIKIKELNY
ncbi:MAG: DUF1080 domain-containing protein [Bacteroidetes bacterium]|jgi:hypothetical protein|nr:DUF1080 domain-containing protein [Bacteroidota bacterium]